MAIREIDPHAADSSAIYSVRMPVLRGRSWQNNGNFSARTIHLLDIFHRMEPMPNF